MIEIEKVNDWTKSIENSKIIYVNAKGVIDLETVTLHGFEEKNKLVECLTIGTTINAERKNADNNITKNKYRNSNSDEVNQAVYNEFKDKYAIDTYRENGYEHIRLYSKADKYLYVLLRETTFQEQIEDEDDAIGSIHYLYAYAYINKWLTQESSPLTGQLVFLDEGLGTYKELLIQQKVHEVMKDMDVEVVQLITYDVVRGKVVAVKSRVLHPEIAQTPIFEEDLSEYIVSYSNEDESVGFFVKPTYHELSEDKQNQEISDLLKFKSKQKEKDDE